MRGQIHVHRRGTERRTKRRTANGQAESNIPLHNLFAEVLNKLKFHKIATNIATVVKRFHPGDLAIYRNSINISKED